MCTVISPLLYVAQMILPKKFLSGWSNKIKGMGVWGFRSTSDSATVLAYGLFESYSVLCQHIKTETVSYLATKTHLHKPFVFKALSESFDETRRFTIKTVKSGLEIIVFLPNSNILVDLCFSLLTKSKFLSEPLVPVIFHNRESFVFHATSWSYAIHILGHLPFSFWQPYQRYVSPNWNTYP